MKAIDFGNKIVPEMDCEVTTEHLVDVARIMLEGTASTIVHGGPFKSPDADRRDVAQSISLLSIAQSLSVIENLLRAQILPTLQEQA